MKDVFANFKCRRCGNCCKWHGYVRLKEHEIDKIAEFLKLELEEFLNESKFEDFYDEQDHEVVYVSTIHKSKGREFDNVYMMLKEIHLSFCC